MSQNHLDRLSATDASFLAQEHANSHMHVGAICLFEGPPPPIADFLDHIRSRLHLVPRYRQKLAFPPGETGRPLWVDDPNFNLEYHVRHTALPAPGSKEQLIRLACRIFSQQLDRSKPLWETWLVERLEGNQFALIEAHLSVATLAQSYRLQLAADQRVDAWPLITLRPRYGMSMVIERRRPNPVRASGSFHPVAT